MAITIGTLARRADVGVETIRFYEKKGLIPEPARTAAGYRQYSDESVRRVLFIRHAKDLGFSLGEIRDLLSFRVDSHGGCENVKEKAQRKIDDMEQRIARLRKMKRKLGQLVQACEKRQPTAECPIIEVLETD